MRQQLATREGFFGRRVKFKVLQAIPHAIFRLSWIERNRKVFLMGSKPQLSN